MAGRLVWDGLKEFRDLLRQLPSDLSKEAGQIIETVASGFAHEVRANYPEVKGNLRRGVRVTKRFSATAGAQISVRSTAPHSHLFERGTANRTTHSGANRGRMPQAPEHQRFIPRAIRTRQRLQAQLVLLLERAGFVVKAA